MGEPGDPGFGHERMLAWHEASAEARPHYLFKLRLTANVRRALATLRICGVAQPRARGRGRRSAGCSRRGDHAAAAGLEPGAPGRCRPAAARSHPGREGWRILG